jgi:hypothetical protein
MTSDPVQDEPPTNTQRHRPRFVRADVHRSRALEAVADVRHDEERRRRVHSGGVFECLTEGVLHGDVPGGRVALGRTKARAAFLRTLLGFEDEVAACEEIDEADGLLAVFLRAGGRFSKTYASRSQSEVAGGGATVDSCN